MCNCGYVTIVSLHHHVCWSSNLYVWMHACVSARKLRCVALILFPQLLSLTSCCVLPSTLSGQVQGLIRSRRDRTKQTDIGCCVISVQVCDSSLHFVSYLLVFGLSVCLPLLF